MIGRVLTLDCGGTSIVPGYEVRSAGDAITNDPHACVYAWEARGKVRGLPDAVWHVRIMAFMAGAEAEKVLRDATPRGLAALVMPGPHVVARPDAPYHLTDQEADIWRMIVGSYAADYFPPATHPMLSQLCRHVVASNRVAMLIEQICKQRKLSKSELQMLHLMQATESGAIVRLSRSMRLTQQSVYRANATAKLRPLVSSRQELPSPWDNKYDSDTKGTNDD